LTEAVNVALEAVGCVMLSMSDCGTCGPLGLASLPAPGTF